MFAHGTADIVRWLRQLRKALPGRPLIISDYYGQLGHRGAAADPMTLLHDFVQLTSGQGVPAPSWRAWRKIYTQAGCRLLHVIEADRGSWFIHIILL
jgi:hypothetical protein